MNKNLITFLFVTCAINGMDRFQKDRDCLYHLNMQLYILNEWDIGRIKLCIKNFACTSKAMLSYYQQEKTGQEIIKNLALHNNISDFDCAKIFGYKTIANKIEKLFGSPPQYTLSFQANDLLDRWYLNATSSFDVVTEPQTLLHRSIEFMDLNRIKILLEAKISLHNKACENVLRLALRRYCYAQREVDAAHFFSIIALLLEKQCGNPNVTIPKGKQEISALMHASSKGDQKLAYILLEYGANPYEILITKDDTFINCFDMEQGQPKGWLKELCIRIRPSFYK